MKRDFPGGAEDLSNPAFKITQGKNVRGAGRHLVCNCNSPAVGEKPESHLLSAVAHQPGPLLCWVTLSADTAE